MVVVDTNFIIRLITAEPTSQAKEATQLLIRAKPKSVMVDRVVIAECLYVLRSNYSFSKAEALSLLTDVLKLEQFSFVDQVICRSMLDILKSTNLSPEDAILAALTTTSSYGGVMTFDKELIKFLERNSWK